MKHVLAMAGAFGLLFPVPALAQSYESRVGKVLKAMSLIDGHNDWAEALREQNSEAHWADSSGRFTYPPVCPARNRWPKPSSRSTSCDRSSRAIPRPSPWREPRRKSGGFTGRDASLR